ncbi:TniQ family protein [Oceaniglobus trochenteri]|uniref:TniQ family protein n=1 Tax=Oceaniglobus trochenteri TaxID=2763260 RepID=UPI003CCA69AC
MCHHMVQSRLSRDVGRRYHLDELYSPSAPERQLTSRLPLTVSLNLRETGFSLMSRLAARNGIEVSEFGRDMGLPFKSVIDGGPEALQKLADLSGTNSDDLRAWSPHYIAARSYVFRGEPYHARGIRSTIVQGCPICLREDAGTSDLPPHLYPCGGGRLTGFRRRC